MDIKEHLTPEQIKEIMKMADSKDAKADTWETLMGIMIVGICISAAAGGCVYAFNHLKDHKKQIAKQEQISPALMKNKQMELQK